MRFGAGAGLAALINIPISMACPLIPTNEETDALARLMLLTPPWARLVFGRFAVDCCDPK
jgi:hypothetical protein